MLRQTVFLNRSVSVGGGLSRLLFVVGATFIILGLLILMFPQILVAMVSTAFIMLGTVLVTVAWKEWQFRREVGR